MLLVFCLFLFSAKAINIEQLKKISGFTYSGIWSSTDNFQTKQESSVFGGILNFCFEYDEFDSFFKFHIQFHDGKYDDHDEISLYLADWKDNLLIEDKKFQNRNYLTFSTEKALLSIYRNGSKESQSLSSFSFKLSSQDTNGSLNSESELHLKATFSKNPSFLNHKTLYGTFLL